MRFPDNPIAASSDFLSRLDVEPSGRWIGTPKLDGWRRVLERCGHGWTTYGKYASMQSRPLPRNLVENVARVLEPWPIGTILDCEWMGPRHAGLSDSLWVFDVCKFGEHWIGDKGYAERLELLYSSHWPADSGAVHRMPYYWNPGLSDRFIEQMTNPLSEGLVVRRHDSKLVGAENRFAHGELMFKIKFALVEEKSK